MAAANVDQRVQVDPGRQAARGYNAQGEVWRNVSKIQAGLTAALGAKVAAEESESSLQLALENDRLEAARGKFLEALQPAAEKQGDVIGYVFAVNGKLNSADIYSSNALFRKLWPRLIKAAATEALGARSEAPAGEAPPLTAVEAFLTEAAGGKESEQEPATGLKLKVRDSAKALDLETVGADGHLVHRNVLAR
jgi:hypothetical protein